VFHSLPEPQFVVFSGEQAQDFRPVGEFSCAACTGSFFSATIDSMLIPQFSLRWLLTVTGMLAVVFLIFAQAAQGHGWAVGVSLAVCMLVAVMLVHGLLFFLVWVFAEYWQRRWRRPLPVVNLIDENAPSPFASPFASPASPMEIPPRRDRA
jgi:hypothetical protein